MSSSGTQELMPSIGQHPGGKAWWDRWGQQAVPFQNQLNQWNQQRQSSNVGPDGNIQDSSDVQGPLSGQWSQQNHPAWMQQFLQNQPIMNQGVPNIRQNSTQPQQMPPWMLPFLQNQQAQRFGQMQPQVMPFATNNIPGNRLIR